MSKTELGEFEARNANASIRLLLWSIVWVGSLILVDKAILYGWHTSQVISAGGVLLNAALGLCVIWTFLRYLRLMDEMQRKIQLQALAFAMGIGLVGSHSYSLLVTAGFVTDPEVSDIILLMTGTYVAGLAIGQFRHR